MTSSPACKVPFDDSTPLGTLKALAKSACQQAVLTNAGLPKRSGPVCATGLPS